MTTERDDSDPRDTFDSPQDCCRYRDAPIEDVMAEVNRQMVKWRDTLDWLAER